MPSPNDFEKYAKLGQKNQKLEDRIRPFLRDLIQATNRQTVESLITKELEWLREHYCPRVIPNRVAKYRAATTAVFKDFPIPEGLEYRQKTQNGLITQHIAMGFLKADPEESATALALGKEKTDGDQDNAQAFPLWDAVAAAEKAVQATEWEDVCVGLMFACQSRPIDIIKLATVEAVAKHRVKFTTQAKQKGKPVTQEINTIVDASIFVDAFRRLRCDAEILEIERFSNSAADSMKNSKINRRVNRIFGEIIPPPFTETELSAHNLRAAGSLVAYHLFAETGMSQQRYVTKQLIHGSAGVAANYDDYQCADKNGKEITEKGLHPDKDLPLETMPKSTTRTSIRVYRQQLDAMDVFGFTGSRSEQYDRILALATEAAKLKGQLAYQKEQVAYQKAQNAKLRAAATDETAPAPESDLRMLQDSELKGKKSGFAEERIRRAVGAIQDWNAGKELEEQIEINVGSLRQLAAASASKVGAWAKVHAAELQAYADGQGHPFTKNSKFNRGKDIAALVRLPWNE
jgi:hypothetical protein